MQQILLCDKKLVLYWYFNKYLLGDFGLETMFQNFIATEVIKLHN